jgi:hypothetical protein
MRTGACATAARRDRRPGLYFVGITWQWTRGSALIGWVKDDAAFIAQEIAAHREQGGRDRLAPGPHEASADESAPPASTRQRRS